MDDDRIASLANIRCQPTYRDDVTDDPGWYLWVECGNCNLNDSIAFAELRADTPVRLYCGCFLSVDEQGIENIYSDAEEIAKTFQEPLPPPRPRQGG